MSGKIGRGWEKFGAWFNNLVKEGHEGYHEGGGIMFTSAIGKGTDRGPKRKFVDANPVDVDFLVGTMGQLKTTMGYEKSEDILNILDRFVGKIEAAKNLRDQIEELKKEISEKSLKPVSISDKTNNHHTTTVGRELAPDSIFIREQWERRGK